MKSNIFMSIFTFSLSIARLYFNDFIGFFIFNFFTIIFLYACFLEINKKKIQKSKETFESLSAPSFSVELDGNSQIITFLVPSLKLFNKIKNEKLDENN